MRLVTTRRVMRDGWRARVPEEATASARRLRLRRRLAEREGPADNACAVGAARDWVVVDSYRIKFLYATRKGQTGSSRVELC